MWTPVRMKKIRESHNTQWLEWGDRQSNCEKAAACHREDEKLSDTPPEDKNPPKSLVSPPETGLSCVRISVTKFLVGEECFDAEETVLG